MSKVRSYPDSANLLDRVIASKAEFRRRQAKLSIRAKLAAVESMMRANPSLMPRKVFNHAKKRAAMKPPPWPQEKQ